MAKNAVEDYLNAVCAGIRARETAEEIRLELTDHIESRIDEYTRCRYDRETAEKKALEDMGEKEQMREQLALLHRRIPYLDLRNSLTKIMLGIFLQFFSIDIGPLQAITTAIGVILIFVGLFQMRKINNHLKRAWILSGALVLSSLTAKVLFISPLFYLNSEDMTTSMLFFGLSAVINFSLLYYFGEGMSAVLSREGEIRESNHTGKSVHQGIKGMRSIKWFYLGSVVIMILGTQFPDYPWLWMAIFIPLIASILWKIYKTQSFLATGQRGFGALSLDAQARTIIYSGGVLVVILPFVISLGFFVLPRSTWFESPVTERLDLQRIENRIGTDELEILQTATTDFVYLVDVLKRLPEEEIANISGTTECVAGSQGNYCEDTGLEASFLMCRRDDQTIYQVVSFSIPTDVYHGGLDSILLPENLNHLPTESAREVYILTEDKDGSLYSQRPVALRYSSRSNSLDNKLTNELICIDYTVADQGCLQWVIICSTFPDDDGTGSPFDLRRYDEPFTENTLDPLAGYVYIRRELWMPIYYSETVRLPEEQERGISCDQEFGFTRIYTIEMEREKRFSQ